MPSAYYAIIKFDDAIGVENLRCIQRVIEDEVRDRNLPAIAEIYRAHAENSSGHLLIFKVGGRPEL